MESDTLLILTLINKLGLLLPCYTSKTYESLESDVVLKGIVRSLLEISEYRLGITSHAILNLLEKINKSSASNQSEDAQQNLAQSQHFLIRILVGCMAYHWNRIIKRAQATTASGIVTSYDQTSVYPPYWQWATLNDKESGPAEIGPPSLTHKTAKRSSKLTATRDMGYGTDSASVMRSWSTPSSQWKRSLYDVSVDDRTDSTHDTANLDQELYVGSFHQTFVRPVVFTSQNANAAYVTEQSLVDPAPLEEPLAKYIFNIILRLILTTAPGSSLDMAALVANLDQSRTFYLSTARTFQYLGGTLASTFVPNIDSLTHLIFSPPRRETRMSQSMVANRVLFFLSASNWNVVFSRIKSRMQTLATTQDEFLDIQELRILEYCHLNTARLSQVLQELSVLFMQFRRSAQLAVAPTLRRMIWNWIESFPADFIALWRNQRRLDGSPDILFDICQSLHDSAHPKGKMILWPLQAVLLTLCPDVLSIMVNFEGGSKANKRRLYLDDLAKAMRNSRNFEAAAHAYVDLIKGASYLSQLDNTALGTAVTDIESSLRERLFDFRTSMLDLHSNMNQRFLVDALMAYYRLDPQLTIRHLIPLFLQDGIPAHIRVVLVRACYMLAVEPVLPWQPPVSLLYPHIAPYYRKLFHTYVVQPAGPQDGLLRKSSLSLERALLKRPSKSADLESQRTERIEVILTLLKAFWTDPLPPIFTTTPDMQFHENVALVADISACFRESVTTIRSMAAHTLLVLHNTVYIERWGPSESMLKTFWTISSQVLLSVAREILEFNDRDEGLRFMLHMLLRLLVKRNAFIQKHANLVAQGIEVQDRLVASVAMEIALLVQLCSPEPTVIRMALDCFALLCEEANLTEEVDDPEHANLTIVKNYSTYCELSQAGTVIPGRVGQQKRIRRLLRQMSHQTMGNLAAWEEGYKRWRILIQTLTRPLEPSPLDEAGSHGSGSSGHGLGGSTPTKDSNSSVSGPVEKLKKKNPFHQKLSMSHSNHKHQEAKESHHGPMAGSGSVGSTLGTSGSLAPGKGNHAHHLSTSSATSSFEEPRSEERGEWQNYTGFLCALGGVCLQSAGPDPLGNGSAGQGSNTASTSAVEASALVNRFMQELVDLLVCDSIFVRETIKEILGADLSTPLFSILLSHLQKVVQRFVTADGDIHCTDQSTLFISQAISVVKMTLERMTEPNLNLFTVDFGSLVFSFARYLHRLGSSSMALQMKLRMCQLTEILMAKKEYLSLRHEIKFRNKLVDIIISWTSDFSSKSTDVVHSNHRATSTSSHTRQGATADSVHVPHPVEEGPALMHNDKLHRDLDQACMKTVVSLLLGLPLQPQDSVPESELGVVKSHLFSRYFYFFLKVLRRCRVLESVETGSHRSEVTQDLQNLLSKSKESVKDLGPLKEYTILAMSNLLSANVATGLRYSLSMGYHEDTKIRTSFMQVLTNILNQGTEFDGLAESSLAEKQEKLLDIILEPDMTVALALCDACPVQDIDDLSPVLVNIFSARQQVMPLIKSVIEKELLRTDSAPELFRRNCIATRLLASFAKRYGSEYLRETLQTILQAIVEQQGNPATKLTFELDPTKAPADTDASLNAANLRGLCQAFLDAITQSSHLVPKEFREFCHFLVQAVSARFPGAQTTAVGGFIFLRFFCPAIVAPETHHLVDPIQNKDLRRGLLLATKVIQNLANDVQFGTKEAFMTPLNNFLFTNRHKVSQFFADLARPPTPLPAPSKPVPTKHLDPADIARLHRFVADNLEKIGRDMMSVKQTKGLASPLVATPSEPLGAASSPADSVVSPDAAIAHQPLPSIGTSIKNARGPSMDSLGSGSSRVDTDRRTYSVSGPPSSQTPHASLSSTSLVQDSNKLEAVGVDVHPTQPGRASMELQSSNSFEGANGSGLALQIQPSSHLSEIERLTKSRKLYDRLCGVVSQLGKPPEVTRSEQVIATAKGSANAEMYREFMRRTSHRNVDPIKSKKLFYQGGLSKEKRPVVYFIARRLIADATDMDLLMLHVFQIMEHVMNKPFDLLLDLTQFGHANEIQSQWIVQFVQLLPAQLTQNLHTIYMYNVNTAFKQYTKRLANTVLIKLGKRIVFPFNLNDLYAHINPAELDLPKGTVSLETDNGVNISPVSRIFHMKSPMPTIIKITNEAIQITSLKKQEVCGMSSYFNDVYHISEVDDVTLVTSPRHDETLVVVKFDRGNSSMTFSSPKYELIYKAIRSARNRFQLSKPAPISERVIRPNNVPGTLLNMALLNSGSDDPNLRLAAYNLLYALSLNFNFDVGNLLFNASGLCIPANNTNFIISISHKIAAVEPRFTLEFLTECFDGFRESSTPMKHLCLEYMAPWLPNLALFCRRGADHASSHYRHALAKTVDVIKVLVDLTVKESEMYPSVQAKIWRKIGRAEELLDVVLNFFVQYAVECGPFSRQAEVLGDTIVTLAAVNVRTAKLISRLRKLLVRTSINPARSLLEHPTWSEIAVLIRFSLMLMYNNPAAAQQYLPEIFFNLVMVIGIGPPSIRASVHGLVINVIQSLVASVTMNKADLKDLNSLVTQFSEPRFRLMFGLNQVSATAASVVVGPGRVESDLPDATPLTSLEIIIQSLLSVLDCQTFPMDVANAWRARWMSLVTSTAFQYNIAIQPRAFVMLGCLASDEVDDDLLYQVLVTLRGALLAFDERDTNLVQSIVLCLTKLVDKLPEDSQFLPSLFWLALAILQIGQVNLFTSALGLMDEILRSLDTQGVFANRQPHEYLLSTRQPFEDTVAAIDGAQGVNFYTDFAFALATYLIKGLHHPTTKDIVLNVLHTFIGIHTNRENSSTAPRRITSQVLGAVVPLLPASAKNGELSELMWHLGLGDAHVDNPDVQDYYHQILDQFETPTETSAILLGSFLVAMLGLCEYEGEQLFLYRFLSEVATAFPGTFGLIYSSYLPKFNHALTSSQHVPTLEAIQSILIAVVRLPKPVDGSGEKTPSHKDKLHELGFTGLLNCSTFDAMPPNAMKQNALLAATLVERIVS